MTKSEILLALKQLLGTLVLAHLWPTPEEAEVRSLLKRIEIEGIENEPTTI